MAKAMTLFVTLCLWGAAAFGLVGIPVLSLGLIASLSGGAASMAGIEALAEGVAPGSFMMALGLLCIIIPGVMFICIEMRRILRTLVQGDPFVPENAARLSRIGAAIALMELIRLSVLLLLSALPLFSTETQPRLSVQFILWIAVAALFMLSQVFREGARLREDARMTI